MGIKIVQQFTSETIEIFLKILGHYDIRKIEPVVIRGRSGVGTPENDLLNNRKCVEQNDYSND
jgi:hypothetical protein